MSGAHEILDFPCLRVSNQVLRLLNFFHAQLKFILLINAKMPTIVEHEKSFITSGLGPTHGDPTVNRDY